MIVLRVVFLMLGAFIQPLLAQEIVDSLFVSGRVDHIGSMSGGEGGVEWLHPVTDRSGLQVGIFSGSLADTTLSYGRMGGHLKGQGWVVLGTVDLGFGADAIKRFSYQRYKAGVSVEAAPMLMLDGEVQSVQLPNDADQHVLRSGVSWSPKKPAMVQLSLLQSFLGGRMSPAFSTRLDVALPLMTLFGGAVVGTHGSSFGATGVLITTPDEYFGGCQYRLGRLELLGVFDWTRSTVSTARMLVGARIPLRRSTKKP